MQFFTSTTKVRLWNKKVVGSCLNVCNHVPEYTAAHYRRPYSVCVLVIECLNVLCNRTDKEECYNYLCNNLSTPVFTKAWGSVVVKALRY